MATLFLFRHAKAVKALVGMKDFDRPLEPSGRNDAARIGQAFQQRFALPERVLCSASVRTRETLEASELALPPERIAFSRALFEADAAGYLRALQAENSSSILLVGHNPATEELASMLAGAGDDAAMARLSKGFPTSGLAVLEFEGDFSALERGTADLRLFLTPDRG